MSALICGSMAYDTIMVFHDKFKNHILPDKVHMLSVSFLVPALRREYGGCAGNIAYNLNLLGEQPEMMATVGHDFEPYSQWLSQVRLSTEFIKILDDHYTAQAYITTDEDDNQITAFHPGAMNLSHLNNVPNDRDDISIEKALCRLVRFNIRVSRSESRSIRTAGPLSPDSEPFAVFVEVHVPICWMALFPV